MWHKLLGIATGAGADLRAGAAAAAAAVSSNDGNSSACSPSSGRVVTLTSGGSAHNRGGGGGGGDCLSDDGVYDNFLNDDGRYDNETCDLTARNTVEGGRGADAFHRLWAECVGDDICAGFGSADGPSSSGGSNSGGKVSYDDSCPTGGRDKSDVAPDSPPPQHYLSSSSSSLGDRSSTSPWERLVAALRDRGVEVSRVLTAHEHVLLEREVADWWRGQGRGLGREQGMAKRLASTAATTISERESGAAATTAAPAAPNAWLSSRTEALADNGRGGGITRLAAADGMGHRSGGIANSTKKKLPVGDLNFPSVVVEGPSSPPFEGGAGRNEGRPTSSFESTMAGTTGTAAERVLRARELDLRGVALKAHEVGCVRVPL